MKNPSSRENVEHGEHRYKQTVEQIKSLNWEKLAPQELQQLMYLAYVSAREFAESLRIALALYPDNQSLKEMAEVELGASNLEFDDYTKSGDHADFLEHFINKHKIYSDSTVVAHGQLYLEACRKLSDHTRAMSVFSREEELSGIFEKVLTAKDWSTGALPAFQYYLKKHIELDAGEGGHHDLTKEFPVDDSVEPFYEARLKMYKAIPSLFE